MIVYAESSAVLSWLLGESEGESVRECLTIAEIVATSELTLVECDRVLHRIERTTKIQQAWTVELRATLSEVAEHWLLLRLTQEIVERARQPFPEEPIRSLDALHVSSALATAARAPGIALLSLDKRVRACGRALGFELLPSTTH